MFFATGFPTERRCGVEHLLKFFAPVFEELIVNVVYYSGVSMVSAVTLGKVVIESAESDRDETDQVAKSGKYLGQPPAHRQIVLPAAMAYVVGGALWIGLGIALYALYVQVTSNLPPATR
jgi:hypothetical protein